MARKNSVYDFLYVDTDRISSLISQMDEMGVLEDISETHTKASSSGGELSGGTDLGVVSAGASSGKSTEYGRQHERKFNARFALPVSFLNILTDHELIKMEPDKWAMGNIALFKGGLTIADMTALIPALSESDRADENEKLAGQILSNMPPTAQGIVLKGVTKIWSVYDAKNWVTHTVSLALSHGSKLEGQWVILGIVDAKPDDKRTKANSALFSTAMAAMVNFSEVLKTQIGRPDNCYGFTPLLLFREVK